MNEEFSSDNFRGVARLFPLPNLVLFPQVVQGLHIFEPRYRQLMADTLADDQLMALALLKPDWDDDNPGLPPIESIACLGRVSWHDQLPDGRYNLRLRGLTRIRIVEELLTDRPYRTARVELLPDILGAKLEEVKTLRQSLAKEVFRLFEADGPAHRQLQELFEGEMLLGQICDVLAYALPLALEIKQALLAEPRADRRAKEMIETLRSSAARAQRKFPPDFSAN
jgi:Lon protease-like protein